ncbi:MAG: TonB-dependent receptor [Tannerellaceae bacterium]|jgi:TonB-linked SusC/RagA family outer membrane protein|nr:TonB-dependent receptor [Tannerellaceae bacterium]
MKPNGTILAPKVFLIMRICLILLVGSVVQTYASGQPQETLSIDMRNVSIEEVLNEIESQSGYRFLYNKQLVNVNRKVNISIQSDKITEVLNNLFTTNDIKYVISERQIVLSRNERTSSAQQQNRTISGTVVDETGTPVIGANIVQKGTTNGIVTDLDGRFSLTIPGNAALTVSYVGYLSQEITTAGRTSFNIQLVEDTRSLDEVVVVGYGTVRKSDLTGAVAKVSTEDLLQLSTTDIGQALAGRVAGVDIISDSGQPGSGVKIRIRGYGSINNSDPLYVVDGFAVTDINNISPQDIESMEILKDASATAIYGSRGANGVVLIQTKKGGFDRKPTFNVNVYGSMSNVMRTVDLLNAWQFATLKREALTNAGMPIDPVMEAQFNYVIDNKLEGTDWEQEAIRTGFNQNYNVSVNGGGTRTAYDFGFTFTNEQGVTRFNDMQSIIVRANNTYKLTNKIELSMNLNYTHRDRKGQGNGVSGYQGGNGNYYGGIWSSIMAADPLAPAWDDYTDNWGEILYSDVSFHPSRSLYEGSERYVTSQANMFSGNVALQLNDLFNLKGFSFRTQYGTRVNYDERTSYSPVYFIAGNQNRQRSSLSLSRPKNNSWLWNGYFSYTNVLQEKHSIAATLGTELQKRANFSFNASASDIPEPENMWYLDQTADATSYSANSSASSSAMVSYFVRGNYVYDNRYLFTATVRADGSSKFLKKWGYFPSFSLGWNVHEEAFAKETDISSWLSQLKVRLSWGQIGNEASAGNSDYVAVMTSGYTAALGGANRPGALQQAYANSALTWEAAEQLNFGADFGLLNMKLSGTVDYFIRTTKDMILATPIPQYAGMWRARTNAGKMRNNGLEVTLKYQDRKGKFNYAIGGNLSFVTNEVLDLGSPDPVYGSNIGRIQQPFTRTEVGREMGYFYGYKTDGLFQTWDEVNAHTYTGEDGQQHLIQPNAAPGDVRFVKLSDDGKELNENDRTYLGSAMPDVTFGLNFNLGYSNFDFMLFLQSALGNEIANAKMQDLYSSNMIQWNMSADMMNRWTGPGTTNEYPRLHSSDPNQNIRFSDRYIEDGSYLRIKNVQLGYTLPKSLAAKLKISRLRVYTSVDNLYVFTSYRGFDPEMGDYLGETLNNGVDMGSYPRPRTITAGLNLTF